MHSWEQRKLGDLIEDNIIIEQSDGNHGELYPRSDEFTDAGIPYIAASAISSSGDDIDFNLVKYLPLKRAEQFRKGVAQNGDILLAHNATVGPCLQLSMEYDFSILSTSLTLFRINENKMNSKFFLQMLRSDLFQNQLFKYMKQTTRSQVPILTQRKLEVCYPNNTQDQELIGTYLSNLDHLITLHQRKYDETKTLKKYMLQKMFPQNGEKVPEIRFDGFTEDWEQRKFGEIVEKYEDPVETPTEGYTRLGIRSHAKGTFHNYVEKGKELETAKMFRVAADKFIVNITFGWEHAVAITDENDAGKLVSHRFPQYSFNAGMVPKYFRYLILDEKFKHHLELSSPGGAGRNRVLKLNDMLQYKMNFPFEAEQKKIAAYFDDLDNLITLHQRKCNELKEIKKYMLQNMFV